MAEAQKAALEIGARQPHVANPALILASEGLGDLAPEECALAWTRAIAGFLARMDGDSQAHLHAIQKAVAQISADQRATSAA